VQQKDDDNDVGRYWTVTTTTKTTTTTTQGQSFSQSVKEGRKDAQLVEGNKTTTATLALASA